MMLESLVKSTQIHDVVKACALEVFPKFNGVCGKISKISGSGLEFFDRTELLVNEVVRSDYC